MAKTLEFIPFDKIESVWKSMETAPDVSPFMYYDYMAYIVRETWRNPFRAVRIACIKDSDTAEILMIIALVKVRGLHPYYKMLGDIGGCDIADALYKTGMTEEEKIACIRFFYDAMPGKLVLRRLYEKTLLYLHAPANRIVSDETVGYADIPVFEDWDSYLKSLSGYSRHNVKRAYMRMERDGVKYNLQVYGGDKPLPKKVWRLLMKTYYKRFHAKYKRGVFSEETKGGPIVQFLKYLHYLTIKKLWFYTKHDSHSIPELPNSRVCVLWDGDEGDEMISFLCGFLTHDQKFYSLPRLAINEKYNYYTPGCILMAEVLKYLKAGGVTQHLDMSRGDEQYKFKMGAIAYCTHDIVLK